MTKSNPNDNPWRAAVLVSVIGADLAVCIGAGYWAGSYIDGLAGTKQAWSITGLVVGIAIGIVSVIFLIRHFSEDNSSNG